MNTEAQEATTPANTIQGNNNIIGDGNYIQVGKPDFIEPDLTQYSSPVFTSPPFTSTIARQLVNENLLIIGGNLSVDKAEIARHVAWFVHENYEYLLIKEWLQESSSQILDIGIRETEEPTIFILPKISPELFGYEPSRFRTIAKNKDHYIIASSDEAFDVWKMPDEQKNLFWFNITENNYTTQYLETILRQKLSNASTGLSAELSNLNWNQRENLVDGKSLIYIASKLKLT